MRGKLKLWWIVLVWGAPFAIEAQTYYPQGPVEIPVYPITQPAFSLGERLRYEFRWNGLRSAEAEITVSQDPSAAERFHFLAQARTVGLARGLWKAQDSVEAFSMMKTLKPISYLIHIREPTLQQDRVVTFDHSAGLAVCTRKSDGAGKERRIEFKNAYDPLSLAFFVRSLEWKAGEERRFEVVDGEERYLLVLRAVAEELVTVPSGSYPAVKFIPALIRLPRRLQSETPRSFERLRLREAQRPAVVKTVEFWLAKDAPRPVLKVRSEAWIGHVDMELISQENIIP